MRKVIGLLGVKGSGKDTCAKFLVDLQDFKRIGFADTLYQEVADAFGVTTAFLGNRDTKETPLSELSLVNCKDTKFSECVFDELHLPQAERQAALFDPQSPRFVLQLWGTEYRRRRGVDSYWLDQVDAAIQAEPLTSFVVTDVRFMNEFSYIKSIGGSLVRIRRPTLEASEALERAKKGSAAHPSETELLSVVTNAELMNVEGSPDSLRSGILTFAGEYAAQ